MTWRWKRFPRVNPLEGGDVDSNLAEIDADEIDRIPRITLHCLTGESCQVFIEPYGWELTLLAGEGMYVESWGITAGTLEIGYVPEGIWLGFDPEDSWVITDGHGVERLRLDLGFDR
jgi:hypothetical protein